MPETPWYQLGPSAGSWPEEPEPAGATAIGPAHLEPVGIFLGSLAMEALERAFTSSPDRAAAGFLLGWARQGPQRPFVVVTAVIPSPDSRDALEGPRFGARALTAMERIWRANHPDEWVVGWFHGRPKRGVALSDLDRFNHFRLFPDGWQIALFVDTERDASLLYRPEGAALVPCDNFYYYRQSEAAGAAPHARTQPSPESKRQARPAPSRTPQGEAGAAGPQAPAPEEPRPALQAHAAGGAAASSPPARQVEARAVPPAPGEAAQERPRWATRLAVALIACYLLLPWVPGSLPWLWSRADQRSASLAQLNEELDRLMREQESLRLESAVGPAAPVLSATSAGERGLQAVDERSAAAAPAPGVLASQAEFEYTVKPGDTMWEISAAFIGDPLAFRELARRNGIANPDLIFPGQRLLLPLSSAAGGRGESPQNAPLGGP